MGEGLPPQKEQAIWGFLPTASESSDAFSQKRKVMCEVLHRISLQT